MIDFIYLSSLKIIYEKNGNSSTSNCNIIEVEWKLGISRFGRSYSAYAQGVQPMYIRSCRMEIVGRWIEYVIFYHPCVSDMRKIWDFRIRSLTKSISVIFLIRIVIAFRCPLSSFLSLSLLNDLFFGQWQRASNQVIVEKNKGRDGTGWNSGAISRSSESVEIKFARFHATHLAFTVGYVWVINYVDILTCKKSESLHENNLTLVF